MIELERKNDNKVNHKSSIIGILILFAIIGVCVLLIYILSPKKPVIIPESISFVNPETSMWKGESSYLYLNTVPVNAINYQIEWSSSDETVLKINKNGYATAENYGNVIVTAKIKDTDISAQCKIEVNEGEISGFYIESDNTIYYEGQSFNEDDLTVYAYYPTGKEIKLKKESYNIEAPETLYIDCRVKISYGNFNPKYYTPTVREDFEYEIEIINPPNKTYYTIGEEFNSDGMKINVVYASGKRVEVQDFKFEKQPLQYKQNKVEITYKDFKAYVDISTHAEVVVDSIQKLQEAINNGNKSIMIISGTYNTTTQITLSSVDDILIFGQDQNTIINGFNIIPLEIKGQCKNIEICNLKLTTAGENAQINQIDLSNCESGNILLKNCNFASILEGNGNYILKIENN